MMGPQDDRGGWICCQLGAREHYAVPRALHRRGQLRCLAADAWAIPGAAWSQMPGPTGRKLGERFSAELGGADVRDFTHSLVGNELLWRARGVSGWALSIARNDWFQDRAAQVVREVTASVVFAHSYAALAPFREGKARGCMTVLGQIDPGEEHFQLVKRLHDLWPEFGPPPPAPPPEYFAAWREECELADWIVVNSEWSRDSLARAGIPSAKVKVIPLPYEPEGSAMDFERHVPAAFTTDRPMRALFVGSAAVYKGIPSLLEAIDQLSGVPIVLQLVGEMAATIPPRFRDHPAIEWVGPVARSEVMSYCRNSDVLVFPSHSDGFGMAQVEAQGWRLPIIASPFCGRVVRDGVNGLVLDEVSPSAIAAALRRVAEAPALLAEFAAHAVTGTGQGLEDLGAALLQLEQPDRR
jgi:glycosyltransferase involved in cell wall biosynthesis